MEIAVLHGAEVPNQPPETGVALAPGVDFDPVNGHRFIRFSFAVSTPEIEDALSRLKPFFAARTEEAAQG